MKTNDAMSLDTMEEPPRSALPTIDGEEFHTEEVNRVRNSLLAGSAAGIASTIACHPFDVLRVKMQSTAPVVVTPSNTTSLGLVGTVRNTIRYGGGLRALYTGLAMPLAAQAVYKGTIFTVNNMTESWIKDWKTRKNRGFGTNGPYELTLLDRFVCGFMGGAVNAGLFCTPVEYVRNQQIAQIENNAKKNDARQNFRGSNGPLAVIRKTIQSRGVFGLWRGVTSTVLRDSVGCGFFFLSMAFSQEKLSSPGKEPPSTPVVIFSGALAGVSFWLWALPVDTLKTWIQNGTASNMSQVVLGMSKQGLWQTLPTLFRGWQVAYSRGAPSAAITVITYSIAFQYLQAFP